MHHTSIEPTRIQSNRINSTPSFTQLTTLCVFFLSFISFVPFLAIASISPPQLAGTIIIAICLWTIATASNFNQLIDGKLVSGILGMLFFLRTYSSSVYSCVLLGSGASSLPNTMTRNYGFSLLTRRPVLQNKILIVSKNLQLFLSLSLSIYAHDNYNKNNSKLLACDIFCTRLRWFTILEW